MLLYPTTWDLANGGCVGAANHHPPPLTPLALSSSFPPPSPSATCTFVLITLWWGALACFLLGPCTLLCFCLCVRLVSLCHSLYTCVWVLLSSDPLRDLRSVVFLSLEPYLYITD